ERGLVHRCRGRCGAAAVDARAVPRAGVVAGGDETLNRAGRRGGDDEVVVRQVELATAAGDGKAGELCGVSTAAALTDSNGGVHHAQRAGSVAVEFAERRAAVDFDGAAV